MTTRRVVPGGECYSPEETARRRDEALKRALSMPPKPFTPKAKTRPASRGRVHKGKSRA